jgi:hypothetical protein
VNRELKTLQLEGAGEILAEVLADDPRAHYFRHAVAVELELLGWSRRAAALATCGEAGARCDCADCGAAHVFPYRCGARACPTDARTTSAIACEKVARKAEHAQLQLMGPWDGIGPERKKAWRTIVLTTKAAPTEEERYDAKRLRRDSLLVRRAFGKFWRSTSWGRRKNVRIETVDGAGKVVRRSRSRRARRDTLAAMGMEGGDGGMIHLHVAVYGEFISALELALAWRAACPIGGFVHVRLMREHKGGPPVTDPTSEAFRNALREVLKYLTKGHRTDADTGQLKVRARKAAALEFAFRNQRRVETCGALRFVPKVTEKDVATQGKPCTVCNAPPSAWKWRGVRSPEYVRQNGGFGLAQVVDDDDAALTRAEHRSVWLAEQQRARELAAANAHHYRPGGKFYGGTPPPWVEDADEWETTSDGREPVTWAT